MPQFAKPPPKIQDDIVVLSYPADHILHIAMNRPKQFNAMSNALNNALEDVLNWFESEPSLWVAILGSTNAKAWCAGMDLKQMVSPLGRGLGGAMQGGALLAVDGKGENSE